MKLDLRFLGLTEFEPYCRTFLNLFMTKFLAKNQCCGAGAGGAEIILRSWNRKRSRN